jgi:hypothetical protein
MNSLVQFWRGCDLTAGPYFHPEDLRVLKAKFPKLIDLKIRTHRDFVNDPAFGTFDDVKFHLSLLPGPYQGNLGTADIVVLMLNPGLGLADYYTDDNVEHSAQVKKLIRQDLDGMEYPFISLNPEYSWTGGFRWWEKKLRKVLLRIAEAKFKGRYVGALKHLSQRMACIEMVPYHSRTFGAGKIIKDLPSAQAAKSYVHETLLPKALQGEIKLIVTRKISYWGLPKHRRHVIQYEGGLTRGAPMGPETPGGKAVLAQCGVGSSS